MILQRKKHLFIYELWQQTLTLTGRVRLQHDFCLQFLIMLTVVINKQRKISTNTEMCNLHFTIYGGGRIERPPAMRKI